MRFLYFLSVFFTAFFGINVNLSAQTLSEGDSASVGKCLEYAEHFKSNEAFSESAKYLEKAAFILWKNNLTERAEKYYAKAFQYYQTAGNERAAASASVNLSQVLSDLNRFPEALKYSETAEKIYTKAGLNKNLIDVLKDKAVFYSSQNNFSEAAKAGESALAKSENLNDARNIKECYGMLAEIYGKAGNKQKSLEYYHKFNGFEGKGTADYKSSSTRTPSYAGEDGNFSPENSSGTSSEKISSSKDDNLLASANNTDKTNGTEKNNPEHSVITENSDTGTAGTKNESSELPKKTKNRNALFFALGFLLTIAVIVFFISRKKNFEDKAEKKKTIKNRPKSTKPNKKARKQSNRPAKKKAELVLPKTKTSYIEQEKQSKNGARHKAADRIEQTKKALTAFVPLSFIYTGGEANKNMCLLFEETGDEGIIILAENYKEEDCRLPVHEILSDFIRKNKSLDPNKILSELNKALGVNSNKKDSVSVGICRINKDTKKISYAGANTPLVIMREKMPKIMRGVSGSLPNNARKKFREYNQSAEGDTSFYLLTQSFYNRLINDRNTGGDVKTLFKNISREPVIEQEKVLSKKVKMSSDERTNVFMLGFTL